MRGNDLLLDLNKLKETEIIRYVLKGDALSLLIVFDNDEDIEKNKASEEEDDEDILNGHLYTLVFKGVKDLSVQGEEADNYTIESITVSPSSLLLSLTGHNRIEDDTSLSLSFTFQSYALEDNGRIKGPDV